MPVQIYKSGAWKVVPVEKIFKAGAFKDVIAGVIYKSGAWKQFFAAVNAQAAYASDSVLSPSNPFCSITFNAAGTCTRSGDSGHATFSWLLGGAASAYDIRFTGTFSGAATLGGLALNTWANLGTNRQITLTKTSGVGSGSLDGSYEIALAGTTTPIASSSLDLTVVRDA